jgi:hypothetical protein
MAQLPLRFFVYGTLLIEYGSAQHNEICTSALISGPVDFKAKQAPWSLQFGINTVI